MELRLDGKVALVTGASRGIGLAIATQLAASGARVMLASRKAEALEAASSTIAGDTAWFAANAGDPDAATACVAATIDRFGGLHVLVNNAATNPYMGPTVDIDAARFDKTVTVNLRGPLVWAHEAWHQSMRDRGGAIVNISSIGALSVESSIGAYNMTKAGLLHLTRTLASEMAPQVRVNAIAPGLVKTDMARAIWEPNEDAMRRAVPLDRLGEPGDIAAAAVFLSSDAAAWITGATLVVDGGMLLH